jgi:hypothetical protein
MAFCLFCLVHDINAMHSDEKHGNFDDEVKKAMAKNVIRPLHAHKVFKDKKALPHMKSMLLSGNSDKIVEDLKNTNLFNQVVKIDGEMMNPSDLKNELESLKPGLRTLLVIHKLDVMAPLRHHANSTLKEIRNTKTAEVLTILDQFKSVPGLFILGLTNELKKIDGAVIDHFQVHKLEKTESTKKKKIFRSESNCVICLENPNTHALLPCGHQCLCKNCVLRNIKKCPICCAETYGNTEIKV